MPYALAIVLAALGWCRLHAIEAIEDSPTIEYVKTKMVQVTKPYRHLAVRPRERIGV